MEEEQAQENFDSFDIQTWLVGEAIYTTSITKVLVCCTATVFFFAMRVPLFILIGLVKHWVLRNMTPHPIFIVSIKSCYIVGAMGRVLIKQGCSRASLRFTAALVVPLFCLPSHQTDAFSDTASSKLDDA